MKTIKKVITYSWFQFMLYYLIRLYSWTFRVAVENEDIWKNHVNSGGRVLICTWHQQFFAAIRYFKKYQRYNPALMISKSSDGEIIAGIARLSGWHPVRGSSSRGGKIALREMIQRLRACGLAAHIMDGPRGPAGKVKPGAIQLAIEADAVIVPFYVAADRAWFFNSWDQFFIPKPFAKVHLRFDTPIHLFKPKAPADFEVQRKQVEDVMSKELRSIDRQPAKGGKGL
jgi:lysophospholipid acyltransferase (LPLAT)-like uncharacterized protein